MGTRWSSAGFASSGGMSLNMFTKDKMEAINNASMEVLGSTGV